MLPQAWLPCRCVAPSEISRSPEPFPTVGADPWRTRHEAIGFACAFCSSARVDLTDIYARNSRVSPREPGKEARMPNPLAEACYELALANRIIAHEGVLDGFG